MSDLKFLKEYSGQTVEQLLALEGEYRIDSLVEAFEQAINQKAAREGTGAVNVEERIILAIEGLEREVNNGGYAQFFVNSSNEFAPIIVEALLGIGCPKTAEITQRAINALHLPDLNVEAIEAVMETAEDIEDELNECDSAYYAAGEDIPGQLFTFIKTNKGVITL
jgi:uncharacterized protein DUF4375